VLHHAGAAAGAALACLIATASPAPGQERTTGRIEGKATMAPQVTSPRQRVRVYAEPGSNPNRGPASEHRFASVVMYLESAPALRATAPPPPGSQTMHQSDERFVPHVLAIQAGATVTFPNDDPIYHNAFSLSRARTFDLGRYARGESRAVRFPDAGVVQVFCHIHADMSGYILVFDHQFFVTPEYDGSFALEGVPPGDYQMVAWHERIRPVRQSVRVEAGRTTSVQVTIPIPEGPPGR
jgi:plastocyanin